MLPFHCCPNRARTPRLLRAAALCALLMGYGELSAAAQTLTSGGLRVHVLGPGTTLPPGTSVQLRPDDAASGQALPLGRDGWATALHLTPGTYQVRAEMLGVALSCTESISVDAGSVTDVLLDTAPRSAPSSCRSSVALGRPFSLQGASNTSLAPEPAEAVDSAARDATLAGAPATESEGDDTDATSASREESQLGAAGPSLAGLSPAANTTLVDGLSATQGFRGAARVAAEGTPHAGPSFGATVRSFRSLPRTFSAQYGGAGGVVAVTSPGHADRLHGTAFLLERGSALSASNPFSLVTHYGNGVPSTVVVKPADTLVEAGASAGIPLAAIRGPLQHASLFGSLEAQLRNRQIVSTPATPGFFMLSAEQNALLANRGVSAEAENAALNFLDSLSGAQSSSDARTSAVAHLDLAPTPRHQLIFGYLRNRFRAPKGLASGASEAVIPRGRGSVAESILHIDAFTGRWLLSLSSRSTNELRGQIAHDLEYETPHAPLPQEPGISLGAFAPQVSIAPNGFTYGTPAATGRLAWPDEHRIELADTLTLVRGRHLLVAGGAWSRTHDRIAAATNTYGSFLYDSGTTRGRDGGLADWITDYTFDVHAYPNGGCPSVYATVHLFCFHSFTQSFANTGTQFAMHDIAAFAEDSLRLPHGLALTLGVRYDYTLLPPPQTPNPALDAVLNALASPTAGTSSSIPEDRNNFGPRVSLAWSPGRRSFTLRLAYGDFYGRVPGATVEAALADTALPSTTRRIRITPSTETLCPQVAHQGFGYPCAYTAEPPAAVAQTTSAVVFARRFRLPAVQRAMLSLEHSNHSLDLRARYAMSIATQLPQTVDLNIASSATNSTFVLQGGDGHPGLYGGQTFSVPLYTRRRSTAFGPITALVSNANATYHAATLEVRLHTRDSLQLRASYTFSRAIDYGPQLSASPRRDGQFDPLLNGYDKGLSSLDVRHRVAGDLVVRSSLHHGPETLRRSLSGFRLSALGIVSSGAPYSYEIFGGSYLTGGRQTINGSGGAAYLPTVGRNTLRLPMRSKLDLRTGRDFLLRERLRLSAFAEAFNLLNTQSFSRVETRAFLAGTPAYPGAPTPLVFQSAAAVAAEGVSTLPFATPTSSTSGASRERQLQLGLRLEF